MQIKRRKDQQILDGHEQIQIIDISAHIKYDFATVEKRLLTMINAMVSHELRNPINSI